VATTANAWRAAEPRYARSEGGKVLKTLRLKYLRTALLAVAVAGLLAAAGLVVFYAQPAEATFPGKSGKIAYSGYDGQDFEIYSIKSGGGGKVRLTDNARRDSLPSYSPSGKQIVYSGLDAPNTDFENFEIYTINSGGGGKFPVTDNGTDDDSPSWGSS
jgi:Tol biopolymer transport system component